MTTITIAAALAAGALIANPTAARPSKGGLYVLEKAEAGRASQSPSRHQRPFAATKAGLLPLQPETPQSCRDRDRATARAHRELQDRPSCASE